MSSSSGRRALVRHDSAGSMDLAALGPPKRRKNSHPGLRSHPLALGPNGRRLNKTPTQYFNALETQKRRQPKKTKGLKQFRPTPKELTLTHHGLLKKYGLTGTAQNYEKVHQLLAAHRPGTEGYRAAMLSRAVTSGKFGQTTRRNYKRALTTAGDAKVREAVRQLHKAKMKPVRNRARQFKKTSKPPARRSATCSWSARGGPTRRPSAGP